MTLVTYKPYTSIYNDIDKLMDQFLNFEYTYNDNQNINPDFNIIDNKNTYILWFLPLLIFLIGGAIVFKKINKY